MAIYIAREATKLWRKVCAETSVELQLLFEKWHLLLAGIVFQVNPSVRFVQITFPRVCKYQTMACSVSRRFCSLSRRV